MTEKHKQKRAELIALSAKAKDLRDDLTEQAENEETALYWASRTVNFMLLNHIYETDGATEFNTFKQWKEQGATIKKGAKAFLIWGQPLSAQRQQEAEAQGKEPEGEDDEYSYFPLCYLFSDKQVNTAEEIAAEKAKIKAKQEEERTRAEAQAKRETVLMDIVA